jgi:hypothetical protein
MSSYSSSMPLGVDRNASAQALRLARTLVGKTVAYMVGRETEHLGLVRGRLLQLLDVGQPLERAQNLRSAYVILGKSGAAFNAAFQSLLQSIVRC